MPVGPLFSILFFIMLFTLGIDSEFAQFETVIKSIQDELKIPEKYKPVMVTVGAAILYLIGLVFCCPVNNIENILFINLNEV